MFTGGVNDCHHEKLNEDAPRRRVGQRIPLRSANSGVRHPLGIIRKIERRSSNKLNPSTNLNGGRKRNDENKEVPWGEVHII